MKLWNLILCWKKDNIMTLVKKWLLHFLLRRLQMSRSISSAGWFDLCLWVAWFLLLLTTPQMLSRGILEQTKWCRRVVLAHVQKSCQRKLSKEMLRRSYETPFNEPQNLATILNNLWQGLRIAFQQILRKWQRVKKSPFQYLEHKSEMLAKKSNNGLVIDRSRRSATTKPGPALTKAPLQLHLLVILCYWHHSYRAQSIPSWVARVAGAWKCT